MSILNKITPGTWLENTTESLHTDIGIVRPFAKGQRFYRVCRMAYGNPHSDFNKKVICRAPDMLSIIERLAGRTEIDPVIDIKAEAQHLLTQLNKEL